VRTAPAICLLALAVLSLPGAQAALNGAKPYEATHPYLAGLDGPLFTMASGRVEAIIPDGVGTWGFFSTEGATVTGLTRVCWTPSGSIIRGCQDSAEGGLSIRVQPGGSFGFQFPGDADAKVEAKHAMAMFVDLRDSGDDLNSLELGRSLIAPVVDGTVTFTRISAIPASAIAVPASEDGGAIAATDATTVIEVRDGGTVRASLTGKGDPVTFAGSPAVTPIATELAVIPFEGGGAVARFRTADRADAEVGLDVVRINRLLQRLTTASEGGSNEGKDVGEDAFGPFSQAAGSLFGGAVLSLPTEGETQTVVRSLEFARTPRLEVRSTAAGGLTWSGKATLDIRDGHVQHAQPLYGLGFIVLPWWGWLLWIAAITVWIVRLVRKPERKNPKWDRFKWVGWLASAVVFLLVFFLWDLEMRAVLGLSLLSGTSPPLNLLLLVMVLQLGTFALLSFSAIAPLRLLLRNTSLLLHQGTFMGLAGSVAGLVGFLIGATLLRSGLDLVYSQVLSALPS
jgi:hypothetical protein